MMILITIAIVGVLGFLYFTIQAHAYRTEIKRIDREMSERLEKRKRPRRTVF